MKNVKQILREYYRVNRPLHPNIDEIFTNI